MKKIIFFLLPLLFLSNIYPQDMIIKSLKAYAGNETAFPILTGSGPGLTIEFDIESEFMPNFNIVFRYCDRNWKPYDNIFLLNHGQNIEYDLGVDRLPVTVEDAKYHFKDTFTGDDGYVSFPFSGKWRFYITDSQDTTIVYASGRFFVIYPDIEPDVSVKNVLLEDKSYFPLELGRVYDITASFILPQEMFPSNVMEMEIIENQKLDYPVVVDRSFNTNTRQFYWNGDRKFSFSARDVRPGNEYRQVDLRNHNVYIGKDVRAHIEGIEISRFYREGGRDLNGGSILTNFKNEYASYLNVKFEIRPPEEISGDIFLVGAFNNWQLLPGYRMDNSGGLYSKTIQLKRGVYDYQYVTADIINNQIKNENWVILEGNFWETENDYHIFIYYNDPNYGGYDRIIGYKNVRRR
ncbi:MAG: DUF5103 domain-containing protein [Ignavibacteriaceae bacterium]